MDAFTVGQFQNLIDCIFLTNIDYVIRSKFFTHFKATVTRACQYDRLGSQALCHRHSHEPDRPRSGYHDRLAGYQPSHNV